MSIITDSPDSVSAPVPVADPQAAAAAVPSHESQANDSDANPDDSIALYEAHNSHLVLPDGRTIAFSTSGPADSALLILWFHGMFSTGDASRPSKALRDRRARFVAADLPGWGSTSPVPPGGTFPATVVSDTRALLEHLYPHLHERAYSDLGSDSPNSPSSDPNDSRTSHAKLRIYVSGGSFGTCPAQIVFGAPYSAFPLGRHIVGAVLLAPFSPFLEHAGYAQLLTWRDWVGVGPPTRVLPSLRLVQRTLRLGIRTHVRDVASAERFLRQMFFDHMDEKERERFRVWREKRGVKEGEFERRMAEGMVRSVGQTWEGFLGVADALHADWGFRMGEMDEEHAAKRVVLVAGKSDESTYRFAGYLAGRYRNARMVELDGGHLSGAWYMDEVWEEMLGKMEVEE